MSAQNEYRLTYHVNNEVVDSTRHTFADSDEHAISIFKYMTEQGVRCREWHSVDRWNRWSTEWEPLNLDEHEKHTCDDEGE